MLQCAYPQGSPSIRPVFRLQNESLEVPFRPDGTPNAYLPPPEETDFPVVKCQLTNDEQARNFLKRLGLSEPDLFDDIVERVLPKYKQKNIPSISPHEHALNIQKILRSLASDSEGGKRKIIQAAKQTPFLRGVNIQGDSSFKKPDDLYFRKSELEVYFAGSSDIWFLNETEGANEWRFLGVESRPRFKKITIDLPWDKKRRLIGKQGHTRDIETIDYELEGLKGFLTELAKKDTPFLEKAAILWNSILEHLKNKSSYYNFFKDEYRWFYYHERSVQFDATWEKQILNKAWLPKEGDDLPYKPSELSLEDLPELFIHDEKLADLLRMGKNVVAKLAEQAGVHAEDIELLKQHPREFQEWKAAITARKEEPAFPISTLVNHERREKRLLEQLAEASEKKYEKNEGSFRITRGTIDPALWLRNQYTNETGQMVCQICKKEMPFRKRDGEYYFEAVEALSRDHFTKEHEAQFLALCPLCAARYKEFVKQDEEAMESFKNAFMNSDKPELSLQLGDLNTSVRFVESHWHDIRTILQEVGKQL